jgi:hypothetical protein
VPSYLGDERVVDVARFVGAQVSVETSLPKTPELGRWYDEVVAASEDRLNLVPQLEEDSRS